MPPGAARWTFTEHDARAVTASLQQLLRESHARCALLVDRAGQLVVTVGEAPAHAGFDATAFASLTAADYAANDQLARLLGERDFATLFHQGERESMFLADVARRVILVVLFDTRTTLGLVRLKLRAAVDELTAHFEAMFAPDDAGLPAFLADAASAPTARAVPAAPEAPLLAGAEDEIDRLFA